MPFKRKLYHPKWSLIRLLIRKRAGGKCEGCGVAETGEKGYWIKSRSRFMTASELEQHLEETGEDLCEDIPLTKKPWAIVLTTAHLDHDIQNNRFSNLACLCQPCHLGHDRIDNAQRRKYGPKGRHFGQIKLEFNGSINNYRLVKR